MIARALAQEPSFLLLDEPTSYLDFKNQFIVLKMICRIAEEKKVTVVITLHDPNQGIMFSDEVVLLRKLKYEYAGKNGSQKSCKNVVAAGAPDEVMTPDNIREAYGIEVESFTIRGRRILFPL